MIDSLVKCGLSAYENLDQQKAFVDHLAQVSRDVGAHVHLVHHLRKGQSEEVPPDKLDLKGAGEIADLADNVFLVWRNKGKERKAREGQDVSGQSDAQLMCVKQRHGEWEGKIALWYDAGSLQYRGDERGGVLPWPNPQDEMDWANPQEAPDA